MIELAEVVAQLRSELETARLAARDSPLRFGLGAVELEMSIAVEREGKLGAKVKFWVVEANADGKLSSATTQRIKLTLHPSLAEANISPEPVATNDGTASHTVYVGGDADDNER